MTWSRIIGRIAVFMCLLGALAQPCLGQQLARNEFSPVYQSSRLGLMVRFSDLEGCMVSDQQGHRIGRIQDVLVDPSSWRVLCALIRPANLYGPAEYFVAIPARCFVFVDGDRALVNVTVTNSISLPRFRADASRDARAMSGALKQMFDWFGQKTYWDEKKGFDRLVRCAVWMDMDVTDGSAVNVGRLNDFVIDLPAERVVFAGVAFFGSDLNTHVMPPDALSVAPSGDNLVLPMDSDRKAALLNADDLQWVKAADPEWVAAVYRAYGRQFDYGHGPSLDAAVTEARGPLPDIPSNLPVPSMPDVPANPAPDTNLPRAILVAFVRENLGNADAAERVHITMADGTVTLAGLVDTEQQRSDLVRIAERLAGSAKVSSQIRLLK